MTRTLMYTYGQTTVVLSLSVVTASDDGPQAITLPLADLTSIIMTVWQFWQWLDHLAISAGKLAARVVFTAESSWGLVWPWLTLALILLLAIRWGACQKPLSKTLVKNSKSIFWAV